MSTPTDLFAALAGIPRLPGALCRGQTETFDAADDDQLVEAIELCRRCPALAPCSAWADTLGDNDVNGVVAWPPVHLGITPEPETAATVRGDHQTR